MKEARQQATKKKNQKGRNSRNFLRTALLKLNEKSDRKS